MSNKYLEKSAALFPSTKYISSLDKKDKEGYLKSYQKAGSSSPKNFGKATLAAAGTSVGAIVGAAIGNRFTRPLAQALARRAGNKVINAGGSLMTAFQKGEAAHRKVRTAGSVSGFIAGTVPGVSYGDHFRHEHAKRVLEGKKKD